MATTECGLITVCAMLTCLLAYNSLMTLLMTVIALTDELIKDPTRALSLSFAHDPLDPLSLQSLIVQSYDVSIDVLCSGSKVFCVHVVYIFKYDDRDRVPYPRKLPEILPGHEIVISGIAGRFPESDNVEELKENLLSAKNLVTDDHRRWKLGELLFVSSESICNRPDIPQRTGKINKVEKIGSTPLWRAL
ncbi:hypothetical protein TSAR_015481 [Trichomalopsis sarcophagae]|uniref:Beta-ketoacyl synthase-like N-terminal domain-containing protein n=1 Tax=Trichomalopsis sarcophagae TaxID=543379 RepID=A0A232EXE0_9HYME|nr:hypothetical protein TSAR_015481 [Trichomalopsis sarcophagae]